MQYQIRSRCNTKERQRYGRRRSKNPDLPKPYDTNKNITDGTDLVRVQDYSFEPSGED